MAFLRLRGDKTKAGGYLSWAQAKLGELRRLLAIKGIPVGQRRYKLSDADILVTKNFRNELIDIFAVEGVSGGGLFLITKDGIFVAWTIGRNGLDLTPTSFELLAEEHDPPDEFTRDVPIFIWPSTVKSNTELTRHVYAITDSGACPPAQGSSYNYGQILEYFTFPPDVQVYCYHGMKSCWQPKGWGGDEHFVMDWYVDDVDYVCGAKRSYQIIDNVPIKNLEFWETAGGVGRIEYDIEEGHQIGPTFTYNNRNDIHAVLSPTKIIGTDGAFTPGVVIDTEVTTNKSDDCATFSYPIFDGSYFSGEEYNYLFGGVTLEITLGGFTKRENIGMSISCPPPCGNSESGCCKHYYYFSWRLTQFAVAGPSEMLIMDYDHINEDETFICFWRKKDDLLVDANRYERDAATRFNGFFGSGLNGTYFMGYRVNGGELQKTIIAVLRQGNYTNYGPLNGTFPGCTPGAFCPPPSGGDTTVVNGMQGQRVSDVTCQIANGYIFYSYAIQDYTGPVGENHFDDPYDDDWTFNNRIVGVIHIETGTHTQHTVDDALLGDLYKDDFDYDARYAIGLHKEA